MRSRRWGCTLKRYTHAHKIRESYISVFPSFFSHVPHFFSLISFFFFSIHSLLLFYFSFFFVFCYNNQNKKNLNPISNLKKELYLYLAIPIRIMFGSVVVMADWNLWCWVLTGLEAGLGTAVMVCFCRFGWICEWIWFLGFSVVVWLCERIGFFVQVCWLICRLFATAVRVFCRYFAVWKLAPLAPENPCSFYGQIKF